MFNLLSKGLSSAISMFSKSSKLDEEQINQISQTIEQTLLNSDVPYQVCKKLTSEIKQDLEKVDKNSKIDLNQRVRYILFEKISELLGSGKNEVDKLKLSKDSIILLAGLQGAGKTTTIGKISHWLKSLSKKKINILTTSLDFRRPAAIEQLKILSQKVGVHFFPPDTSDMFATLQMAMKKFKNEGYDYLLIDTPGRLQIDQGMMDEIKQIEEISRADYKILVLDSMTGQESLNVAKEFDKAINLTGAILSKADSDSRGGTAVSFYAQTQKPILFLGTGEGMDDLEKFIPKRIASRVVGGGDMETLMEQMAKKVGEEKMASAQDSVQKMMSGDFSFQDFINQTEMVSSMGSLRKIASYIPGLPSISDEQAKKAEEDLRKFKAFVMSMTKKEKFALVPLSHSRKSRIAKGAGYDIDDLNGFLSKFEESKRFVKMFKKDHL